MNNDAEIRILAPNSEVGRIKRELSRRNVLVVGGLGALGLGLAACTGKVGPANQSAEPVSKDAKMESDLLIGNWADYTDPASYTDFTSTVGPKVTVDGYASNDEILAKLRAGGSNFDIVVPAGFMVKILIESNLAMKLNHELLPNLQNLRPKFRQGAYDPDNAYSVPKDFGITSFFYRTAVVKERPKTLIELMNLIPKYPDAQVNFLQESHDVSHVALAALGKDSNTESEADFAEAEELLKKLRPFVDTFDTNFNERALRGQVDIGMSWNGPADQVIEARKKEGDEVIYLVPEGDGYYWVDNWLIPASARNPVAAHAWINSMLEPKNAGREMTFHHYAVPVTGVEQHIDPALAANPVINISDETLQGYQTGSESPKRVQLGTDLFTKFQSQ